MYLSIVRVAGERAGGKSENGAEEEKSSQKFREAHVKKPSLGEEL